MTTKSSRVALVVTFMVLTLLAAGGMYHALAYAAYQASFSSAVPLDTRLRSAERATSLEPWHREYEVRRVRLEAEERFVAKDWDAAHKLMEPVIAERAGDAEFVEFYHAVNAKWVPWSSGKAHQQHGHEGPGGTLRPEDIER